MTIKDYKCKCGRNDFFFADKGNQKGIYCSYCGKWLKWADKDEQNLRMSEISETEIKAMTKEQNYFRGYKDGKSDVLDKIRAEIIENSIEDYKYHGCGTDELIIETSEVLCILDKYKAESEDKE